MIKRIYDKYVRSVRILGGYVYFGGPVTGRRIYH